MIEVFKLTHNIYDESVSPQTSFRTRSNTRGNNYKLLNHTLCLILLLILVEPETDQ